MFRSDRARRAATVVSRMPALEGLQMPNSRPPLCVCVHNSQACAMAILVYMQLAATAAVELRTGAADGSEMGVFSFCSSHSARLICAWHWMNIAVRSASRTLLSLNWNRLFDGLLSWLADSTLTSQPFNQLTINGVVACKAISPQHI